MNVVAVVNNNNVVYEKKYSEVLINKKYFIFDIRFNFNLMNVVERYLYHNVGDCLKL